MPFRLAVAGKGGSGKTTLSGSIIRALVERARGAVLAVDADPNPSLGLLLGMEPETTLADVREQASEMGRGAAIGVSKHAAVEFGLQTAVCEGTGVDLLTMGRPEGPGCYCYVNNLLRGFLENLAHPFKINARHLNLGDSLPGNDTQAGPGFTDGDLYFQPLGKFIFI